MVRQQGIALVIFPSKIVVISHLLKGVRRRTLDQNVPHFAESSTE